MAACSFGELVAASACDVIGIAFIATAAAAVAASVALIATGLPATLRLHRRLLRDPNTRHLFAGIEIWRLILKIRPEADAQAERDRAIVRRTVLGMIGATCVVGTVIVVSPILALCD